MVDVLRYLHRYEQAIRELEDPEDVCSEALILLAMRDTIARLSLTETERVELVNLDNELVEHWEILASCLPFPSLHPRENWWWFLHEGPQVRTEMFQVA